MPSHVTKPAVGSQTTTSSIPSATSQARSPELPFGDDAFDLVLSSHLLISYADRFDRSFHHNAVRELMRVAATEVRIFPLVTMDTTEYPHLDALRQCLADDGITTDILSVDYEFQAGANAMLVCTRSS